MNERKAFDISDVAGSLKRGAIPTQQDILNTYTAYLFGSRAPEKTLANIKALEDAGFALEGATPTSDVEILRRTGPGSRAEPGKSASFVPTATPYKMGQGYIKEPQPPSLLAPPIPAQPIPTPILDD